MIDLDALVNKAVGDQFAEPVTYDPRVSASTRGAFATRGVFDKDHEVMFTEVPSSENQAAGHATTAPVLGVRTTELGLDPRKGDRVTIRGQLYEVWSPEPDGDGWVDLVLKKRS